jgi:hypothetical protein
MAFTFSHDEAVKNPTTFWQPSTYVGVIGGGGAVLLILLLVIILLVRRAKSKKNEVSLVVACWPVGSGSLRSPSPPLKSTISSFHPRCFS